jgi:hypothetical protein
LSGRVSLTARSRYPVSKLRLAAARLLYVCPYSREGAPFALKLTQFSHPSPLMTSFRHPTNAFTTCLLLKSSVPETSTPIEYP